MDDTLIFTRTHDHKSFSAVMPAVCHMQPTYMRKLTLPIKRSKGRPAVPQPYCQNVLIEKGVYVPYKDTIDNLLVDFVICSL